MGFVAVALGYFIGTNPLLGLMDSRLRKLAYMLQLNAEAPVYQVVYNRQSEGINFQQSVHEACVEAAGAGVTAAGVDVSPA